jgi:hypothetical protein
MRAWMDLPVVDLLWLAAMLGAIVGTLISFIWACLRVAKEADGDLGDPADDGVLLEARGLVADAGEWSPVRDVRAMWPRQPRGRHRADRSPAVAVAPAIVAPAPTRDAVIMRDQVRADVRARLVRQQEGRRELRLLRRGF